MKTYLWFLIVLLPLISLTIVGKASAAPAITISSFIVTPRQQAFQVTLTAVASQGTTIGSFGIRTNVRVDANAVPAGFFLNTNGYAYLEGTDFAGRDLLKDNGTRDADARLGTLDITIPVEGWPDGRFTFVAYAHNRPASGAYIMNARSFVVQVRSGQVVLAQPVEVTPLKDRIDTIVYKREGIYAAFPSLVLQTDGSLWTSFTTRTRRSHIDDTGGYATMVSRDGGLTWSDTMSPLVDPKWLVAKSDKPYHVLPIAEGWVMVDAAKRQELLNTDRFFHDVRPGTLGYLGEKAFSKVSADGGVTWTQAEIATLPIPSLGLMNYNQEASYIVTAKGTRLAAIYGRRSSKAPDEVFAVRSTDGGINWTFTPLAGPTSEGFGLNETALLEVADSEIIALMRTMPEGYLYISRSQDDGVTWSAPEKTPILGHPAHLLKLRSGDILATYGYRYTPMGIRAVLSHDGGRTWEIEQEIILRADAKDAVSDVGYPITVQLGDGSLYTIYYITLDDGITHIAGTQWRL